MSKSPIAVRVKHLDPFEVTRRVAQDYGVDDLAPLIGRTAAVLHNKLNPNESTHHQLTLADFIGIILNTKTSAPLVALNHLLGHACFPALNYSLVSDQALIELINKIGAEGGDFYRSLNIALADQKFSRADFEQVRNEALEWMGAIGEAVQRIEGLIDE